MSKKAKQPSKQVVAIHDHVIKVEGDMGPLSKTSFLYLVEYKDIPVEYSYVEYNPKNQIFQDYEVDLNKPFEQQDGYDPTDITQEFIVDKIISHGLFKNKLMFHTSWKEFSSHFDNLSDISQFITAKGILVQFRIYIKSLNVEIKKGLHNKLKQTCKKVLLDQINRVFNEVDQITKRKSSKSSKSSSSSSTRRRISDLASFENPQTQEKFFRKLNKTFNFETFVLPKQDDRNCWFNCLLVSLFVSDKGRENFKIFRELMIYGVKEVKGTTYTLIPPAGSVKDVKAIWKSFFHLNYCIENLFEGKQSIGTNSVINKITENTKEYWSYLIKQEKERGLGKLKPYFYIQSVEGNPQNYLDVMIDVFRLSQLFKIVILYGSNTINFIKNQNDNTHSKTINPYSQSVSINDETIRKFNIFKDGVIPNILVLEYDFPRFNKHEKIIIGEFEYEIDSICCLDLSKAHYCCLFTLNGIEYMFDGASNNPNKYEKKDWKKYLELSDPLTKNDFNLHEHDITIWNLSKGYSLFYYYRVK